MILGLMSIMLVQWSNVMTEPDDRPDRDLRVQRSD